MLTCFILAGHLYISDGRTAINLENALDLEKYDTAYGIELLVRYEDHTNSIKLPESYLSTRVEDILIDCIETIEGSQKK